MVIDAPSATRIAQEQPDDAHQPRTLDIGPDLAARLIRLARLAAAEHIATQAAGGPLEARA